MPDPLTCMIAALWFEAREHYADPDGIMAVADVIQNRVEDPRWPDEVCLVVYEDKGPEDHDCQFSFACDGLSDVPDDDGIQDVMAMDVIANVARKSMNGERLGITSNHYHTRAVKPYWAEYMDFDGLYGGHMFYTWKR